MSSLNLLPLVEFLEQVPDPRIDRGKKFSLLEILLTAICAVLQGSEGWNEVAEDAEIMESWFRNELGLKLLYGIPSHDTYRRVFSLIDPAAFQKMFSEWVQSVQEITEGQVIAIDGKTLRGAFARAGEKSPIHIISAWATDNGLVLGQLKSEGKANEIRTVPKLLELLKIRGCIVTTDAMNCQKETVSKITEKGADYVICLKGNHRYLRQSVESIFEKIQERNPPRVKRLRYQTEEENKHGRVETRSYCVLAKSEARRIHHLDLGNEWSKLRSITQVISTRKQGDQQETIATRYYLSSLEPDAQRIAHAIRSHWGVENQVHWAMDVSFREDESRIRKENSPVNFALIRRLALNLLRQETSKKGRSIRMKRKRCGWSSAYLLKVLMNQQVASV